GEHAGGSRSGVGRGDLAGGGRSRVRERAGAGDVDTRDTQTRGVHAVTGRADVDLDGLPGVRTDLERGLEAAVEQLLAVERGRGVDPVQLRLQLPQLGLDGVGGVGVDATGVGRLHRQVTHALQDAVRLGERTFSGLHDRDAVLGVADGD